MKEKIRELNEEGVLKREGLRGCAQEGELKRGYSGEGAQVLKRGCSGGVAQEGGLKRGCSRGGAKEGVLGNGFSGGGAQEVVLMRDA